MTTLIVPCAGRNFINNQPRWALDYSDHDILLSKCIKTLGENNYDRVVATILEGDLIYYTLEDIRQIIGPRIEICILNKQTNGPADTIYETITRMGIKGEIQIKDIDILFEKPNATGNFISGINLLNYDSDLKNARNKSFITRNEKNVVMDIVEKNVKSDLISVGLYGFMNADDFVGAYLKLKKSFDSEDKIYVSHIITYLIGAENRVFDFVEIPRCELLESAKDYERSIKKRGLYIIDSTNVDIATHLEEIKEISLKGGRIAVVCNEYNADNIALMMEDSGIEFHIIIGNGSNYACLIGNNDELKEAYLNAI